MRSEHERHLDLFGSRVAIFLGDPPPSGRAHDNGIHLTSIETEAVLRRLHSQLTRFNPESELCRLNRNPSPVVEVSPSVLALAVAVVQAGELTNGLVDATLLRQIERCGYEASRVGVPPAPLREALLAAPTRRAANPAATRAWAEIEVDSESMTVTRPPGIGIDSGGVGKGLAVDLLAHRLAGYTSFAVDCGGDLRVGGSAGQPRRVEVEHPFPEYVGATETFDLTDGAVATSGIRKRVWRRGDGYAHHILDPSTGRPAWTGVIQATALAPTGVEAEARAKAALLAGPNGAGTWLEQHGGLLVCDDGAVNRFEQPRPASIGEVAVGLEQEPSCSR